MVAGSLVTRALYRRQRARLLTSVRTWLPDHEVEDIAVGHSWSSTWPIWAGLGMFVVGTIFGSDDRIWITLPAVVVGFGLLLAGWLAVPATLIVTTSDRVILLEGRRRTYEPVAEKDRIRRSSWVTRDQLKDRGLWVPALWKQHLPPPPPTDGG